MDVVKNNEMYRKNPEYQKKQFEMSFLEIWTKITKKIIKNIKDEETYNKALTSDGYKYFFYLRDKYGFDISWESVSAFSKAETFEENKEVIKQITNDVYERFIHSNGVSSGSVQTADVIHDRITNTLNTANKNGPRFAANEENYRK